jgi:hypothetical protein
MSLKIVAAIILLLVGSHLFLYAWLRRRIDAAKRDAETGKKGTEL